MDFRWLLRVNKIAVLGCSHHPGKPSHDIPEMLSREGFEVLCINPKGGTILGKPVYRDPCDVKNVDVLVVFRPSREIPTIVNHLLRCGSLPRVFWMQEGIRSVYAREVLEKMGVKVVEDRCIWKVYLSLLSERDDHYRRVLSFVKAYAAARGFALDPDPERLEETIAALAHNEKKYGYRYCPCRSLSGNLEEDRKKICPCTWHEEEIRRDGHCRCRLFWDPTRVLNIYTHL